MYITVKEIKESDNASLISWLCYNMFDETNRGALTQKRICKELEQRGIIESASDMYKKLNK